MKANSYLSLKALVAMLSLALLGCSSTPPSNPDDICSIFKQKRGWKKDARRAEKRWGSPVPVMMAIMRQESSFVDDAKPGRVKFLGLPLWRKSSSYGYSQAKADTWRWYERSVGRNGDRDDFDDAIDFIGWYNYQSHRANGIARTDAYSLYLAYHEGHGGYRSGTYKKKKWLTGVAVRVRDQSARYAAQYKKCP